MFFAIYAFFAFFHVFYFCHNFWTKEDLDQFSTSRWPPEPQFWERYSCSCQKMTRSGLKMAICKFWEVSSAHFWYQYRSCLCLTIRNSFAIHTWETLSQIVKNGATVWCRYSHLFEIIQTILNQVSFWHESYHFTHNHCISELIFSFD